MPSKNLGRGLSAFLDMKEQVLELKQNDQGGSGSTKAIEILPISISDISTNPYQPRQKFDEESLKSLAESIKSKGVLQPILVVKITDGFTGNSGDGIAVSSCTSEKYQLVAGERRLRASKLAGLTEIPALITKMGNNDQLEVAVLENVQREDLNPIEEAEAYKRLMGEFKYTQEQISAVIGKSRSHIANILRLLTLPDKVKGMLRDKVISFGHARVLIGLSNASEIAERIVKQKMSVRETENLLQSIKGIKRMMSTPYDSGDSSTVGNEPLLSEESKISSVTVPISTQIGTPISGAVSGYVDPELLNIAHQISSKIGLQVGIKVKNKKDGLSGGVVEIFFKNFSELDNLLEKLHS